eukprot:SAG11_NODE_3841_length_2194_cov_1.476850_2_plen_83_part_00
MLPLQVALKTVGQGGPMLDALIVERVAIVEELVEDQTVEVVMNKWLVALAVRAYDLHSASCTVLTIACRWACSSSPSFWYGY